MPSQFSLGSLVFLDNGGIALNEVMVARSPATRTVKVSPSGLPEPSGAARLIAQSSVGASVFRHFVCNSCRQLFHARSGATSVHACAVSAAADIDMDLPVAPSLPESGAGAG
jgi:LSD1 subclass zinc finger protein